MINLDPHFVPRSKLVCVSCLNLKAFLDPALESVLDSVVDSVQEAMQSRCQTLAGQLDDFCYVSISWCAGICVHVMVMYVCVSVCVCVRGGGL